MISLFKSTGALAPSGRSEKYFVSLVSCSNCFLAATSSSGEVNKSRTDEAMTLDPIRAPLWAIDIVGVIPADQ
ncbi:hypothetical protein D3C83_126910 [compost metagenome]